MKWFGHPGGAPYESDCPHVGTPVGEPCAWCDEVFDEMDDGLLLPVLGDAARTEAAYHYECHLRQLVGGLNHQRGTCTCCGGPNPPDPPELNRRQAAKQAVLFHQATREAA